MFVVYGSLVPLDFKPRPDAWHAFLSIPYLKLGVGSRADWVANILLYVALSYLATGAVETRRWSAVVSRVAVVITQLACLMLAVSIEFAQLYFPPRTVSLNDLVAEFIGTGLGCGIWFGAGNRVTRLWERFLAGGPNSVRALLGLYVLAYVGLSLFPYDFLVSFDELRAKLARRDALSFATVPGCSNHLTCGVKLIAESVLSTPLGVLLGLLLPLKKRQDGAAAIGFAAGCGAGAVIETIQLFLASGTTQAISIFTRGVGVMWGAALATDAGRVRRWFHDGVGWHVLLIALPLYAGLLLSLNELLPLRLDPLWAARERLESIHFLPFYYHYFTSETMALRSLLIVAGSYAPIGIAFALVACDLGKRRAGMGHAIIAAGGAAMLIETLKLFGIAKHADPTNLLIAATSGGLAYRLTLRLRTLVAHTNALSLRDTPGRSPLALRWAGLLPVMLFALVAATTSLPSAAPDPARANTFPPPEALPPVSLPGFSTQHPRLPHPIADDLAQLAIRNPGFLTERRDSARRGDAEAAIFSALASPGSQNLDELHARLMAITFTGRGDTSVKTLSLAYDWLYGQWSYVQRIALQDKLAEGCKFVVNYIRTERLSPYNAILYNSPLQALMACSIALYGEHPAGDGFMSFTDDIWKKRVLPVWRQVFGRNGGWHEGGEYVSVGIGQAVYTLPAMWEAATGERIFDSEAGLRGFLDFLIYRTRPDGTQFRWGDGAYFARNPVDAIPLAIRYRNAAAYTLLAGQQPAAPSGWPWGPLTDASLIDSSAAQRLPLTRLFDGIGLVVARSDWGPDATYVTFKAGDNYWSHSHLDQGAFTIYKGGPLAIDSGVYGPRYGSDHHLNYAYQTVAHNTITVTDPADDTPLQRPDGTKHIANDGGQRRVGSGWGLGAPIDRQEWEAQREIYHTGKIVRYWEQGPMTVAVADLTPAYTNSQSGKGEFAQRTRRVEHAWRVFAYDRAEDVIVIYDDIQATSPSFRKHWLLHTINEPQLEGSSFATTIPAEGRGGRSGGRLAGQVLLPLQPNVMSIGGRGFEFFVDGRNYDEDGKLMATLRKGDGAPEPGNWRIEISPTRESASDQFLVALRPMASTDHAVAGQIHSLSANGEVGCEVQGRERNVRYWFTPGKLGVRIEQTTNGKTAEVRLGPDIGSAAQESPGWLGHLLSWMKSGN